MLQNQDLARLTEKMNFVFVFIQYSLVLHKNKLCKIFGHHFFTFVLVHSRDHVRPGQVENCETPCCEKPEFKTEVLWMNGGKKLWVINLE